MAEATRHDLELPGCTPEPIMAYLKALGILRLVSEQKDAGCRGWWKNDVFRICSSLDRDALVKFFLEEYKPSPIVGPWAGGSGFFQKDNKRAVEDLAKSKNARVRLYAEVIHSVQAILKEERVGDKPKGDDKARLIRRYRSELPDQVVAWMDAAMVLHQDAQGFAPILGTGGNDGRLDFTQNFMRRLVSLGFHDARANDRSTFWLDHALFSTPTKLDSASVGQFSPGRAGGPNATHGMEGDSTDNPWDFILMMEGTLLLAGAAVRRLGVADSTRAAFPFTVRAVAAGFDSAAPNDHLDAGKEAKSRGEVWLPLWHRPVCISELGQLFGEGRAEVAGHRARTGMDFARAAASLAVDRGITEFRRFGFLKRSGKAFLATPLGRHVVSYRDGMNLLREVDAWLNRFRRTAADKDAPPRLGSAVRRIDSAIFEFCKYGGASFFQRIAMALGAAERELRDVEQFREDKKLRPLAELSSDWIKAADDGSPEFSVACALAAIHDPEGKIGPLRANLEPVDWKKRCNAWAEKNRSVVWNAADLATNLINVLERRVMDGSRAGCERLPIATRSAVTSDRIAAFLAGELDDRRITDLIWGLMIIRGGCTASPGPAGADCLPLPRAYALLKLLFLPRPLIIEHAADGKSFARLLRSNETGGVVIRPEPAVLHLLRSGRLGEACAVAMRRLRASGLNPMPGPIRGQRVRDGDWRELDGLGGDGICTPRLAAALLIPITDITLSRIFHLVIHGGEQDEQAKLMAATHMKGGT